jgi:chitinase
MFTRGLIRSLLFLGALVMGVACAHGKAQPAASSKQTSSPIVLGYYPSWDTGISPPAIRYELFTHLAHAFVTATTEGLLRTEGNLPSEDLTRRAHNAGVKVLLSVGGADSGAYMGDICLDDARRANFIGQLLTMVERYGYDGIDLDWEFPRNSAERDALTTLARELREALGKRRLLTAAQSGTPEICRLVDMRALQDYLDFVSVMTYDIHGPWSGHAGHNAPMRTPSGDRARCTSHSLEAQMAHWRLSGSWGPERLLVGIPCSGRGFPVPRWYMDLPKKSKYAREYVAFRDVEKLLQEGWKKHWDEEAGVPWLASPTGQEIISYDDEASAKEKGAWAKKEGYGGIFFWEITQDVVGGRNRIVEAARAGFLGH